VRHHGCAMGERVYRHHHSQRKPLAKSRSEKRPPLNVESARSALSQGISPRPILMFTPRPAGQLVPSFIIWMAEMAEDLKTLIAIQDWVLKCRRLASETPDPETARQLLQLANKIEQRTREVDAKG
jgi:hypothetical protein